MSDICKVDGCTEERLPKRGLCKDHLRDYQAERARQYRAPDYIPPHGRERVCRICGDPAIEGKLICAAHRNERERKRLAIAGRPCGVDGCQAERVVGHSYCLEHKRAAQRKSDNARRRAQGSVERIPKRPPADVPEGHKWCWGCAELGRDAVKPVDEFHLDTQKSDGLQTKCKVCQYERYQERLEADPEHVRSISSRSQAKHRRRRVYGMDEEQFLARLAAQGGVCVGCLQPPLRPVIDHDHGCCGPNKACEKCVRWILCSNCNSTLGFSHENPATLHRLAGLLEGRLSFLPA